MSSRLDNALILAQKTELLQQGFERNEFASLLTLLRYAVHGCFAIALCDSVPSRSQVVRALSSALAPLPLYEWTYSQLEPNSYGYLDHLTEDQQSTRAVVSLYDLERAGKVGWTRLDMQRDYLAARPHGLVLWLTSSAHGDAIRNAPNFWSQRSGVFDFRVATTEDAPQLSESAMRGVREHDDIFENREEIARQLRMYQRLLGEYEQDTGTTKRTLFEMNSRLSQLLYFSERYAESKTHALTALSLAHYLGDLTANRAM